MILESIVYMMREKGVELCECLARLRCRVCASIVDIGVLRKNDID